jgi:multiple sugar transport system permease protein
MRPAGLGRAIAMIAAAVWCVAPFGWQLLTSLKPLGELYQVPPTLWPFAPSTDAYTQVFSARPFHRYLFNSVVVAGATTAIVLLLGGLAGYALARLRFPGRRAIRWAILMVAMFPPIGLVSPLFALFDRLGLLDTYAALILPYTVFSLPLGTWILASYFAQLPREIEEAALVDGCSRAQALWKILLPLAGPGLATAGILVFIYAWNEFLFALAFTSSDAARTVPVAIALFPGLHEFPWGEIAAASILVTAPVILLVAILQRRIVHGLTVGAVTGS